jgi:multidrug efflux pump subunit AcrA (membrane-fusion protein)
MFGRGLIYIYELENVIIIPQDSVITLGGTTHLVPLIKPDETIEGEGIVELRHVTLGDNVESNVIVKDGILTGEYVVYETQGQLSDGIRVRYAIIEDTSGQSGQEQ